MTFNTLCGICSTCAASFVLATQVPAQVAAAKDTLALEALNRTFRLLPIELSIDLSRGTLNDAVPGLKPIAAGGEHVIWGRQQRGDSVQFALTFRRDSMRPFGGEVTRRARIETVEVIFSTDSAERAVAFATRFQSAVSVMGEPHFCELDTMAIDVSRTIFIESAAVWRRGDVTVMLDLALTATEPLAKYRPFAPRFRFVYTARRRSDTIFSGTYPRRHDSRCGFTDDEIRRRARPTSDAEFDEWQKKIRHAPPYPP